MNAVEDFPLIADESPPVIAFAIGNAVAGNVWALFVDPAHEGRGHGGRLHDVMVGWLWSRALSRLWLTTGPGTRADAFYARRGWRRNATTPVGELRLELQRPPPPP